MLRSAIGAQGMQGSGSIRQTSWTPHHRPPPQLVRPHQRWDGLPPPPPFHHQHPRQRLACQAHAALSAALPEQPRRGLSSQPPWWQFWQQREEAAAQPSRAASRAEERELQAVQVAATVNVTIFVAKVVAWLLTSSGAMLAEALHSAADIVNQLLLLTGVQRSKRLPTRVHPYGYQKEKCESLCCRFCCCSWRGPSGCGPGWRV